MDHKTTISSPLLKLLLHFSLTAATVAGTCPNAACRRGEPEIRFPFWLEALQPKSCGYPGFKLSCDGSNRTVVHLPGSGLFGVQIIDYGTQEIWVNDPGDYTLFNCSSNFRQYRFAPIGCMSRSGYTVFATSSVRVIRMLSSTSVCGLVATVAVPVELRSFQEVVSSDLGDDLRLAWTEPRCGQCEWRGGRCGIKNDSSLELVCLTTSRPGLSRSARYAITVGAGVPALLFAIGLVCFICGKIKYSGGGHRRWNAVADLTFAAAPQPSTSISGLDGPTIESFPKVVLGESRRLPKPDHATCSICLCEYKPKDTLRSIPECQHCFHAECIDEWLRLNATCPVCRTSPERSPRP
ncbi:hypothetical protein NMG60_11020173 [Bertholletia excelsa]